MKAPGFDAGPLARHTFVFGAPLALALACHGLFNLVDLVVVGRCLPPGAIAAVTMAGVIVMVPMLLFDGICNAVVAWVAWARGARRDDVVRGVTRDGLVLAAIGTVASVIAYWPLAAALRASFSGAEAAVLANGDDYLRIMSFGAGTMFIMMVVTAVLRGVGNAVWPVVILVGANVLNLVLNVVLVPGWRGIPALGVAGAAWATVIARAVGAVVGLVVLWRGGAGVRLQHLATRAGPSWIWPVARTGLLASLQLAWRVIALWLLLKIAADAPGTPAREMLDGVGISIRLEMVAVFVTLGWGAAATTVVGQCLGAGRPARAQAGALWTLLWATVSAVLLASALWVFRGFWFRLVVPDIDARTEALGLAYWMWALPAAPLIAVGAVLGRALNGATDTLRPLIIDVTVHGALLLPLAWWWAGRVGAAGAWQAQFCAHALAAVAYTAVFSLGSWRERRPLGVDGTPEIRVDRAVPPAR